MYRTRLPRLARTYATVPPPNPAARRSYLGPALVVAAAAGAYYYYDSLQSQAAKVEVKTERIPDLKQARGRSIAEDIEAKSVAAKDAAIDTLERARESSESMYKDARSAVDTKAAEAHAAAEKKAEQAKQGWFSWLGWGRSKAEAVEKEGARKIAEGAQKVEARAERHS